MQRGYQKDLLKRLLNFLIRTLLRRHFNQSPILKIFDYLGFQSIFQEILNNMASIQMKIL